MVPSTGESTQACLASLRRFSPHLYMSSAPAGVVGGGEYEEMFTRTAPKLAYLRPMMKVILREDLLFN